MKFNVGLFVILLVIVVVLRIYFLYQRRKKQDLTMIDRTEEKKRTSLSAPLEIDKKRSETIIQEDIQEIHDTDEWDQEEDEQEEEEISQEEYIFFPTHEDDQEVEEDDIDELLLDEEQEFVEEVAGPADDKGEIEDATELIDAISQGDYKQTQLLIIKGFPVNVADSQGITPLFMAINKVNPALVSLLIAADAPLSSAAGANLTPMENALHVASSASQEGKLTQEHIEVIRLLHTAGARISDARSLRMQHLAQRLYQKLSDAGNSEHAEFIKKSFL